MVEWLYNFHSRQHCRWINTDWSHLSLFLSSDQQPATARALRQPAISPFEPFAAEEPRDAGGSRGGSPDAELRTRQRSVTTAAPSPSRNRPPLQRWATDANLAQRRSAPAPRSPATAASSPPRRHQRASSAASSSPSAFAQREPFPPPPLSPRSPSLEDRQRATPRQARPPLIANIQGMEWYNN